MLKVLCLLVLLTFGAEPKKPKQDLNPTPPSLALQVVAIVVAVIAVVLLWWLTLVVLIVGGVIIFFVLVVGVVLGQARPHVDKDAARVGSVNPLASADASAQGSPVAPEGFPHQNNAPLTADRTSEKARLSEHENNL